VTPDEETLRDAFLAECWPVCREVSREERAAQKARTEADAKRFPRRVEKAGNKQRKAS